MFLIIPILIHLYLLINTKFTLWPEMVVYPYLVNNNFLLYKDIINPYPPMFTGFLSIFAKLFGYHPEPYQYFTWILILAIDLLVFTIARKIFKKFIYSFASLTFFIFLSIPFSINGLWFDLVQTPFIILSVYFFYKYIKSQKKYSVFISILFLTIAFFIKQQAIWLILWFLIVLLFKFKRRTIDIILKNKIIFLPFFFLFSFQIIFFWQKGILTDFLFWNYYFPFFQASTMPGYILLPTLHQSIATASLFLFFLPVVLKKRLETIFIFGSSFVLLLFGYPRFDYFHLVPALAILSLAAPLNINLFLKSKLHIKFILFVSLVFLSFFTARYLVKNWTHEIRFFESDIITTASFLHIVTDNNEPIYIQNGPDQLLPLAQRLPPKPWADEFPWYLEIKGVQESILTGLTSESPRVVIFKPYEQDDRYQVGSYKPGKVSTYLENNYQNFAQISSSLWLKIKK